MSGLFLLPGLVLAGQSTDIDSYTQNGYKDIKFKGQVTRANSKELVKIDDDYKIQFSLKQTQVIAKEPFKFKVSVLNDDTNAQYAIVGAMKVIRIPALRISQKIDTTNSPGQRQTMLDFGLLTSSVANDFFTSKFVRMDRETGNPVFDLTYRNNAKDKSRMRVWLEKSAKYVVKREWYGQQGQLKATFQFSGPIKVGGITVPTKLVTYNAENQVAGELKMSSFEVNTGVADSVFNL